MSLQTPARVRRLQRALYAKAKQEPAYRFYLLYDKVYRGDVLHHAYHVSRAARGARTPGVDGVTFADIEAAGREEWLAGLEEALRIKTYRPAAVRRVLIPKPDGGDRPLGIPTVRDRVVQTAAKLVLEPIFEADFDDSAYGYRPKRSATGAVRAVHEALCDGYTDVVDADLSKYFDTIPHQELLQSVARRVVDRHLLHLLKMWLKVPVEERDDQGKRHMRGGKQSMRGTPQGGVLTPRTQKVTFSLSVSSTDGGFGRYLICVVNRNMFVAHDTGDQGTESAAAERRLPPARAAAGGGRGRAVPRTRVRVVAPASIPLS